MFVNCSSLRTFEEIKLPAWQVSDFNNIIRSHSLRYTFENCTSLREITIKYIKTNMSSPDNYSNLAVEKPFYGCTNFEKLYVHMPDFSFANTKSTFYDKFVVDCPNFNYWYVPNIKHYMQMAGDKIFL